MNTLFIVGLGPGCIEGLTREAYQTLEKCPLIMGYKTYVKQVKKIFPDKEYKESSMYKEVDRCKEALKEAHKRDVCLVCSGDSGVYGMAGLVYEVKGQDEGVHIQIISGVSAAQSGAALIGSPLTNDYVVISLSDILTPFDVIKKRIEGACMGDFCIVFYNPMSKTRQTQLREACTLMLHYKDPHTVCAIVHAIGREDEWHTLLTLEELQESTVDMVSTLYIGNSQTTIIDGKMITRRGYKGV